MEDYVSAREAAKFLGVSDVTVSTWCRQGRVPGAFKVSKMWLIPSDVTIDDIDVPKMGRPSKEQEEQYASENGGRNGNSR